MTTVLAIAGSARRGGNSDTILEVALDVIRERGAEVETIIASELTVTPCRSCRGCWETGVCVVEDVMQGLYGRFCEADHIVVAAPVYFASVPGHLKVLIDRFQCFWARTFRLGDPPQPRRHGMFLSVGARDDERFHRASRTVVASWMACLNMKCAVSRFFRGLDAAGDIQAHPEYLAQAREAASELLGAVDRAPGTAY